MVGVVCVWVRLGVVVVDCGRGMDELGLVRLGWWW